MSKRNGIIAFALVTLVACGVSAVTRLVQGETKRAAPEPGRSATPPEPASAASPPSPPPRDHGWTDRRPIGVVMFCDRGKVTEENPSGWIEAARPDPERLIDTSVRRSAELDVQAALFWDIEGARYEVPITYVGDPRVVPPGRSIEQMRRWSQRFRDRGVKVGGTVRPQVLIVTKNGPQQFRTPDYYAALAAKVSWARETLGWTVFYVDTNTTAVEPARRGPIPAEVFARLADDFPDCLFMPEFSGDGYPDVPRVCPMWFQGHLAGLEARGHPWGVLKPTNAVPTAAQKAQYQAALKAGCITLVTLTWNSPETPWVMQAERAARPAADDAGRR